MSKQVLQGIRVLDFGRFISGPFCSAILADLGADVIRVERVEGGEDRWITPVSDTGDGAMFLQCNRSKRSLSLDLQSPEGRRIMQQLVAQADVAMVNMSPGAVASLGLDYDSLKLVKPDIILVLATAYGSGGPYSEKMGFDGIGQVVSGAAYRTGQPDEPMRMAVPYVDFGTALSLAIGTLAALMHRRDSGEGQVVEGSLLSTALNFSNALVLEEAVLHLDRPGMGNRTPGGAPIDIYRTRDGSVLVQVLGQTFFKRWCRMVGRSDLFEDPRFASDALRGQNGAMLNDLMADWCAARTRVEAMAALDAARIPASEVKSPRQVLQDPHVQAMKYFTPVDYPGLPSPAPVMEAPFRLSRTPASAPLRAPRIGEHTDEILADLGYSQLAIDDLRQRGIV